MATVLLMFSVGMHLDVSTLRPAGGLDRADRGVVDGGDVRALAAGAMPFGVGAVGGRDRDGEHVVDGGGDASAAVEAGLFARTGGQAWVCCWCRTCWWWRCSRRSRCSRGWARARPTRAKAGSRSARSAGRLSGGAAGVAVLIAGGKLGLPRLMRLVASGRQDELMLVVAAASWRLGAAVLTGAVGLSPELRAFIAGFC
ncbi:MAG: hypothetical protein R3B49_08395 [Phycisphaerales bacterium]